MRSRGKMSNRASTHKTLPKSRRHETTCCSQPQQMIISEWTPLLLSSCVKFMLSHLPALPPPHRIEHAPSVRIISFSIRAIDPTPDPSPKPCVVCACGSKSASFHWPTPQFFSLSLSLQMLSFTAPPFSLSRPSVGVVEHPIRIKPVEPKKKKGKSKKRLPHAAACCCWRSVQSRKRSNNKKPKIAASFVCLRPELIRSAPLSPAIAHVLISDFFLFFSTPSSSQGFLSHLQQRTTPSLLVGDGARHMSEILSHGAGRPRSCDFRSRM